jgi:DNA-binding LytR/AlgR family response regulator
MRILIIEDEPNTANYLAETLQKVDASIVIENIIPSVMAGLAYFRSANMPELIFADIQLGDGLSFQIFKEFPDITTPVIFCTAYDEYALEAFDTNGINYILKPFDLSTVTKAIQKYKQLKQSLVDHNTVLYKDILSLFQKSEYRHENSILIYQNEKIIPLAVSEIALCFVQKDTTLLLCFSGNNFVTNYTLDDLEMRCGRLFFRVNRQYLINRKAIREVTNYYGRKLLLQLNIVYKAEITISKEKSAAFLDWLSKF